MTVTLIVPTKTGQEFSATAFGKTVTIPEYAVPQEAVELQAFGGRVNEYDDLATVDDSRAVLRQQYDGKSTLDLRGVTSGTTMAGTTASGQPVSINVSRMTSKDGWAPAQYYMLETDENGDLVLEPGDFHRVVYVSGASGAYTQSTIAAHWNAANGTSLAASAITGPWLLDHPEYGDSAAMKVSKDVCKLIMTAHRTAASAMPDKIRSSYWIYQECGYDYAGIHAEGWAESPLHPFVYLPFGTGTQPDGMTFSGNGPWHHANHVFNGVGVSTPTVRSFENWLIADARIKHEFSANAIDQGAGLTLYRTKIYDVVRDFPVDSSNSPTTDWLDDHPNRISGTYYAQVLGSLLESAMWDHNGWAEGYSLIGEWNNGQYPQPPSIFSHNQYTSQNNADMTWRNVLSMRSASVAGQMRIGGWQFNCTSIDNQIAFQNSGVLASDLEPGKATENGFLSLNIRSVATSGQHLKYVGRDGGRTTGFDWQGVQSVDVDCMALHLADPDNPAEIAAKTVIEPPVSRPRGGLWSNFVARNWKTDINLSGLSTALIDTITIQRRAAQLLGQPTATIADYANYVRGLTPRQMQLENKAVNRYLLSAREPSLELELEDRTVPEVVVFKPDWRGEGFRLDNPLNLSSKGELIDGDSLNLNDNYAKWVIDSLSLDNLETGPNGLLDVNSGKVSFAAATPGAKVKTSNCGKLYFDAFDGDVMVRGGRFAVTGASKGSVDASGQGEVILGSEWTVEAGDTFCIAGDMGKVGWDSISGSGILRVKAGAKLELEATPVLAFNNGNIRPWDYLIQDMKGQTSGATGKFDSWRRRSNQVWVRIRDLVGTPVVGEKTTAGKYLKPASGTIAAIQPATIGKIEAGWKGRLGTDNTTATFQVILEAGSFLKLKGRNYLAANTYDLGGGTGTRVTFVDQGATKDAGFSVTSGKLTLTI